MFPTYILCVFNEVGVTYLIYESLIAPRENCTCRIIEINFIT